MKKFGLVLLLFLSSCSTPQKKLDYSDFQNRTIEWNNLFDQYQTEYEVYIYSTYCLYCYEIKDDILNYGYHKENFFLIIYNDQIPIGGDSSLTIGKTNLEDVFIVGTPTLIQIKDKKITENLVGKTKILEQIK